ncbi:PAS domain-containing protein [Rhodobacter ferrooxidans]|uniref:PAS fold-3 domain-containing protein n=1 Tax=Rhodobacter ferrooxidans TaxID=371731 RepID=C8S393_9RHOB|nr:PAS domain-containing protein [Rhodobacter sp. SW2]EEW24575.1 conserved hypothetical protein [Rhodobacter sp. SW2]
MTTIKTTNSAARVSITEPGESPFALHEIFYSRTDGRGVIRAGNALFRRVSGHDWPGLIGAPHKIIRHPDMPRAVFWLLWQTIKSGQPVGAYVKNLARDGRHYWVFAVVLPLQDGYLSVRIKPSGPLFALIKAEYAALRSREQAESLSPEASANGLLARLTELGFSGYGDFMARALAQELAARDAASGGACGDQLQLLHGVSQSLVAAAGEQTALTGVFESLQSVQTNIRIVAGRLEPAGGPISAIADNYKVASGEILTQLRAFAGEKGNLCDRMAQVVTDSVFLTGCALVQSELVQQYQRETEPQGPNDVAAEMAALQRMEVECAVHARAGLTEAVRVADDLARSSVSLKRVIMGLDAIRVMGKVECGRLMAGGTSLATTIDQLDRFHADIRGRLDAIAALSGQIRIGAARFAGRAA